MTTDEGANPPIDYPDEQDPIKQLKGETHRKFDKLGSQLSEMQKSQ